MSQLLLVKLADFIEVIIWRLFHYMVEVKNRRLRKGRKTCGRK
jgi:hypothetical protein